MDFLMKLWNQIYAFADRYVIRPILSIRVTDAIDILLLATLLFVIYRFVRRRRAGRVLFGLLFVVVCCYAVTLAALPALSFIVGLFASAAFFIVVVIFQPEIRDALEKIGNSNFLNPRSDTLPRSQYAMAKQVTGEVADAVFKMSASNTGALIVFEGLTKLGDYVETGKPVDARVTSALLQNIFYDKAPLHDGALIIRNMQIYCASCVLPSSVSKQDFGSMGTRHRAAVGVTEVSDALVVVVSEQTGIVSVAQAGKLLRGVDEETLKDLLMTYLAGNLYLRTRRHEAKNRFFEQFETTPIAEEKDTEDEKVDTYASDSAEEERSDEMPVGEENNGSVEPLPESEEAAKQ